MNQPKPQPVHESTVHGSLPLILALASVYVIWGSTYLVMRWVVAELPPMLMGAIRFLIAGSVLALIARYRGSAWPTARQWQTAAASGGLLFVGGNGLVAIAEQTVSSSAAAVACATMPLWLALFTAASGERITRREVMGQVIGFAGVLVLLGGQLSSDTLVGALVVVAAPVSWAAGSWLARTRHSSLAAGVMGTASQMLAGGVLMAAVGWTTGESISEVPSIEVIAGQLYLIVAGSLIGFTAYAWLLRNTRPAVATSYAFVNPPIAVVVGAFLGGEVVGGSLVLATALVVSAVALVVLRPS